MLRNLDLILVTAVADTLMHIQARRKWGAGGALTPQFLGKQLTLSQPGGGRLCPPQ